MSDKHPQPTAVLTQRLQRVAKWLDQMAEVEGLTAQGRAQRKARANTCWQAAGRLEELSGADQGVSPAEGSPGFKGGL